MYLRLFSNVIRFFFTSNVTCNEFFFWGGGGHTFSRYEGRKLHSNTKIINLKTKCDFILKQLKGHMAEYMKKTFKGNVIHSTNSFHGCYGPDQIWG